MVLQTNRWMRLSTQIARISRTWLSMHGQVFASPSVQLSKLRPPHPLYCPEKSWLHADDSAFAELLEVITSKG